MSNFAIGIGSILEKDFREKATARWIELQDSFSLPNEKLKDVVIHPHSVFTFTWKWWIPDYIVIEYKFDIHSDGKLIVYIDLPDTGIVFDNVRGISPERMADILTELYFSFEIMGS